ncbi:MAG: polysaccharide deacetylase family protein [Polyangia bacterium]
MPRALAAAPRQRPPSSTPTAASPLPAGAVYSSSGGRLAYLVLGGAAVAAAALYLAGAAPGWLVAALLALRGALVPLGCFFAPAGVFGPVLLRGAPTRPLVALTFDDGPDPVATPRVLAALARHGATATFFVIGDRAARHPEVLAQIHAAGHQIENHSLRHAWGTAFAPPARLAAELRQASALITAVTGQAPRWLRAPIGVLSPRVFAAAERAGLGLCGWSGKARDGWRGTSVEDATRRLLRALRPGAILLLHDAPELLSASAASDPGAGPAARRQQPVAAEVLDRLLPVLAERGLRPVRLDELLPPPPHQAARSHRC